MSRSAREACVIGSGPNGLAAAIHLARHGYSITVYEAEASVGGAARSAELTEPGFVHDLCSAIHPLALSSPFFRRLPLREHGLHWIHPPAPFAHPLDRNTAIVAERSLGDTARSLGRDGATYRRILQPFVEQWSRLAEHVLGPLRPWPVSYLLARFGMFAFPPATVVARTLFRERLAPALLAGNAAHSTLRLDRPLSSGFGIVLATTAHAVGWPLPRGGSQRISDALASYFRSIGGTIHTGRRIDSVEELPAGSLVLFDVTPRQLLRLAGHRFPESYRKQLGRYRYGPAAFKVDWALDAPVPWSVPACSRAGTVHLGGDLDAIATAERQTNQGEVPERPFVIVAQQSLFDETRAPGGKHTAWAYCHVPNASTVDMTARVEAQIERFAPGFCARILARHVASPAELERRNANLVGGDFNGGVLDLRQSIARPTRNAYRTPDPNIYLCSSSTPPGGGVHGMCGYHAAEAVLHDQRHSG